MGFPGDPVVKNLPAMWEAWAKSLGWEDPLEKGMAPHSSILAWRIPWTEESDGLRSKRMFSVKAWALKLEGLGQVFVSLISYMALNKSSSLLMHLFPHLKAWG